jgi:hypothetical protein
MTTPAPKKEERTLSQKAAAMNPQASKAEALELCTKEEIDELIQADPWAVLKNGIKYLTPAQFGVAARKAPVLALTMLHKEMDDNLFNDCAARQPWTALQADPLRIRDDILLELIESNPDKIGKRMENNPKFAGKIFSIPKTHKLKKRAASIIAQAL